MLFAENSVDYIIVALSIIYAGGLCVPIDPQSNDEIVKHIIDDSEAKRIFVDQRGWERLHKLHKSRNMQINWLDDNGKSEHWRQLLSQKKKDNEYNLKAEDQAVLFYTSGTTGMPKGVPLTHANIIFQLKGVREAGLIKKTDKILLPLPLFHVYPFCVGLLVPFFLGLPVILPKSITGPEIIRAIKEGNATVLVSVPRLLRALYTAIESKSRSNNIDSTAFDFAYRISMFLNSCFRLNLGKYLFGKLHKRFSTLRLFASGGALLDPELAQKLKTLGWQTAVGYGLTETAPLLTIRMPNNTDIKGVGKPIPGVEIRLQRVLGDDNEEQQSEIQVKGKNVFAGYRNLPDKTAESFTEDGWFKTGDTGYMWLGNLHVEGRISTTLKSEGGKKIQPEEIEKAYMGDSAIREVGILQDKQKLVALVVPNITAIGHSDPQKKIAEILKKKSEMLPSYYRINDFAITKQLLPRTNLGKIRRQELIECYERAREEKKNRKQGAEQRAPLSAEDKALLEESIAREAWEWLKDRFPEAEITLEKSPQLDLNVDSLEWLNLALEIQERFGIELSEEAIAHVDTVRDLIKEIVDTSKLGTSLISPFEEPDRFIDEDQKKWLQPLEPGMLAIARFVYLAIVFIMRTFFQITADGIENIPSGQVVFIPNHASYLDPFALVAVLDFERLRKTQWAGWAGIALANPFNAFIYRLGQSIPIESKHSLISSLALAAAVLKKKRNLVWFPEGERTLTGKLLSFKSGIGMLLERFAVKVVPVHIVGTRQALPPGAFFPRFKKITIVFGEAVLGEELLREGKGNTNPERIANALHDRVNALKPKNKK